MIYFDCIIIQDACTFFITEYIQITELFILDMYNTMKLRRRRKFNYDTITCDKLAANISCTVAASLQQICSNCVPPGFIIFKMW